MDCRFRRGEEPAAGAEENQRAAGIDANDPLPRRFEVNVAAVLDDDVRRMLQQFFPINITISKDRSGSSQYQGL